MKTNRTDPTKPDTKKFVGPDLAYSSGSPNQHKTRVTKHPHTISEDKLPPGAMDIRNVDTDQ